jgi:hypothetical protein
MEELLYGCSPAEFWVWNYLVLLAGRQGSGHVILPKPGEDQEAEKVMTRRHLKRVLKSLRAKFHLTNLLIPRSKSKRIEVLLPGNKIGGLNVRNPEKDDIQDPNKEALGARMSPITTLRTSATPISAVIQDTLAHCAPRQAKLNEVIERLLKLSKQGDLKGEIGSMSYEAQGQVLCELTRIVRVKPKGKNLSQGARLYATMRFMQESGSIDRPQAWIDNVARGAEREMNHGAQAYQEKVAAHHPQGDQAKARSL